MLSSSRWQGDIKLKFIPQLRAFPPKIHNPLLFFIYFFFSFHFSSDPFVLTNTFQHASEMWLILWWKKDPLRTTVLTFFILMTNLESVPDETFIILNIFCWGGNWPGKHWATTCIYSTLTSLFPISVKHLWVILPTFLAYDWLFEIWHLNFRYVHLYLCSQWVTLTRHFEIKMPVALFNGDWQKARFWFICLVFGVIYLNHTASCKLFKVYKNNSSNEFFTYQSCRRELVLIILVGIRGGFLGISPGALSW